MVKVAIPTNAIVFISKYLVLRHVVVGKLHKLSLRVFQICVGEESDLFQVLAKTAIIGGALFFEILHGGVNRSLMFVLKRGDGDAELFEVFLVGGKGAF